MKSSNIIGMRVKQMRIQHKMGQVDLAAALSVEFSIELTQSDISEIERGARGVKDFELDALAHILEVSPGWLLRGEDSG